MKNHKFPALFILLFFSAYIVLVSWYIAITFVERKAMPVYLPFLFTTAYFTQQFPVRYKFRTDPGDRVIPLIELILPVLILFDIFTLVLYRAMTIYGGN